MRVLQQHGFTAAVNSTLIARNYSCGLKICDMIAPATTHYGMPLFLRRYPKRIEDFAYDLFFGRPVLIVQHSADFVNGWDDLLAFRGQLNKLKPGLQWLPLGKIVETICQNNGRPISRQDGYTEGGGYTLKSYLKTALRRKLCDIRDEVILTNSSLRTIASKWL